MSRPATVSVTSSALRASPDHASEQTSRLLLGEGFQVLEESPCGRWARGRGPDGYEGWLSAWHLAEGEAPRAAFRVSARHGRALAAPEPEAALLADLSFGAPLPEGGETRGGWRSWTLPDGAPAWTPEADLAPARPGPDPVGAILRRGRGLLGVPYEWGGRSSAGLDCSGLVQLLLTGLGLNPPRDSGQQAAWAESLDHRRPELWLPGDLLFYGDGRRVEHLGLLAEEGKLLHASAFVRVEDLLPGGSLPGPGRPTLMGAGRWTGLLKSAKSA